MKLLPKEALDEYIGETRDLCDRIWLNLAIIEKGDDNDEVLKSIYRDVHSIKGSSFLFGFKNIGQLTHTLETALDPVRQKEIKVSPKLMDALYCGMDYVAQLTDGIASTGEENVEISAKCKLLIPQIIDLTIEALGANIFLLHDLLGIKENLSFESKDISKQLTSTPELTHQSINTPKTKTTTSIPKPKEPGKMGKNVSELKPVDGATTEAETRSTPGKEDASSDSGSIRIQVELLDNLMNLVGELVLVRNQLLRFNTSQTDPNLLNVSQRLNIVTTELQTDVMKTRMQTIGTILTKFHRVVRDMSKDLGKKIELKLEGAETELDKTLIEAVKDPLTHLVRNCVDHGLELPQERSRSGKPSTGTVLIKSYHEGGQVLIEITDDGRGLVKEKIVKKALEKGLLTEDQVNAMSEREIKSLIFAPGFSTAEKVSNISGRGVGMDVVKTNIEKIGGTIEVQSKAGVGTTIRLKIPLTLAIIPALIIQNGSSNYAIPQAKVVELVRFDRDRKGGGRIEYLQGRPVFRLRGLLLPLIGLSELLGAGDDPASKLQSQSVVDIVVLSCETGVFGLVVSQIIDSIDIVVKPLNQILKQLNIYSGATIMGDGSVVLILDVAGISSSANVGKISDGSGRMEGRSNSQSKKLVDISEYLMTDVGIPGRYAIPLCLVSRLEEFDVADIKVAGDQHVVLYRNALLPLIAVDKFLKSQSQKKIDLSGLERISVVVMSKQNRLFGLYVKKIIDVVQIESNINSEFGDRAGIFGTIIHNKEVISVIDAHKIIDESIKTISGATINPEVAVMMRKNVSPTTPVTSKEEPKLLKKKLKILLVEDTAFFRKHVKSFVERSGYDVVAVANGDEALKALDSSDGRDFSLVITDIEMPIVDGFELVKKIRSSATFANLPVIALTTRIRPVDLERGLEAGFTAYLEKLNEDVLLENMNQIFGISVAS